VVLSGEGENVGEGSRKQGRELRIRNTDNEDRIAIAKKKSEDDSKRGNSWTGWVGKKKEKLASGKGKTWDHLHHRQLVSASITHLFRVGMANPGLISRGREKEVHCKKENKPGSPGRQGKKEKNIPTAGGKALSRV